MLKRKFSFSLLVAFILSLFGCAQIPTNTTTLVRNVDELVEIGKIDGGNNYHVDDPAIAEVVFMNEKVLLFTKRPGIVQVQVNDGQDILQTYIVKVN